ncbi:MULTISPECIES: class F sortase [Streptomyces]|uniref:Sortase (Surface protein transpeptidase) n=2 Tax=Streptomyces TaxID=1883 RepID=A0ABT9LHR4_STRGD|nr:MULTISPECIES: class F sortase [Streptomyces]MDP9682011.1 sortase (surface protein transpeptidase) [Streptomyces griseoviridis]GGT03144.1 class F sortase [Streptomyces griseoviridis]GGU35358.1 class F sortase [Streptomyces daghestanicus]GHI34000.1 class F sortase [Streptomyces daghestanicus]
MPDREPQRSASPGRLVTGIAWTVLFLGLWLWGRGTTDGISGPATGDMTAAGRPPHLSLPPAHAPLDGDAAPRRLDIPELGVSAPVTGRGLDAKGALEPPPFARPDTVGWWTSGATPGAAGTALMVGHVDTDTRPAVFYRLSTVEPGGTIRVLRADGRTAEFTVDDVRVLTRADFDARQAYGQHRSGRAELRLITCGGTYDRVSDSYTANVVVSAYLTGTPGRDHA